MEDEKEARERLIRDLKFYSGIMRDQARAVEEGYKPDLSLIAMLPGAIASIYCQCDRRHESASRGK